MKRLLLLPLLLAGCTPCEPLFKDGEIVRHKLTGAKYIVIQSSDIENMDGMCLVTVRSEDTRIFNPATVELERIAP